MEQILERKKLKILIKPEEIYVVSLKNEVKQEEVEEQKVPKKLRLFAKHKKTISIEKLKGNIDAKIYRNIFVIPCLFLK